MDRHALAMLIPIIALSIPVVAIVMGSMVKMARFKAEAQRVALPSPETDARIAQLEDEVHTIRQELTETQERLDFTERLLAKRTDARPEIRG